MVGLIENVNYLNDFEPQVGDKLYLIGDTKDDFGGSQLEKLIYGKVNHEYESLDLSSEVEKVNQSRPLFVKDYYHMFKQLVKVAY